jgi:alpha/beta superfamily hydrolase
VQGVNDRFGSRPNVERLFNELIEPKELMFVEGADHFFTGHLIEMAAAIDRWLDETYPELRESSSAR